MERRQTTSETCESCFGFGSIETGVNRYGHGISGGLCMRCGGSGQVEVTIIVRPPSEKPA